MQICAIWWESRWGDNKSYVLWIHVKIALYFFSKKKKKKLKNNNKNNPHISFQEKKFQDNSARLIAMGKMEVGIHHRIRRQRDYFFRAPYTDGFLLLRFAAPWAFVYILFNSSHLYYLPPHDKLNKWCISACWTASSWN